MTNPFMNLPPQEPPKKARRGPQRKPEVKQRDAEIVRRRRAGASLAVLADAYGVSRERVRQICEREGIDKQAANDAWQDAKNSEAYDRAKEQYAGIIMHFMAGKDVPEIAKIMGTQAKATQKVVDENMSDQVRAFRSKNLAAQRFPGDSGPKESKAPRVDRKWPEDLVLNTLVNYIVNYNDGVIPSSTEYQKLAPQVEGLPSFPTVRNRLGRWSVVRLRLSEIINNKEKA